jgi:hypothetical protein
MAIWPLSEASGDATFLRKTYELLSWTSEYRESRISWSPVAKSMMEGTDVVPFSSVVTPGAFARR